MYLLLLAILDIVELSFHHFILIMITKMELEPPNMLSFLHYFGVFVVLCLIIPGQSIDGFDTEYIPAISTGIFIILGLIIFIIKNKNKNAIL